MNFITRHGRALLFTALLAVASVCWLGCGGDDNPSGGGGGGSVSLAGTTWMCTESYYGVMEVTYTLTFTASTVKMEYLGQTENGTYTVKGSSITIKWDGGYTGFGSFSVKGNKLTSSEGNVFTKQ
jgi:hypothetical protein